MVMFFLKTLHRNRYFCNCLFFFLSIFYSTSQHPAFDPFPRSSRSQYRALIINWHLKHYWTQKSPGSSIYLFIFYIHSLLIFHAVRSVEWLSKKVVFLVVAMKMTVDRALKSEYWQIHNTCFVEVSYEILQHSFWTDPNPGGNFI